MWEPNKEQDDNIDVTSIVTTCRMNLARQHAMYNIYGMHIEKWIKIIEREVYDIQLHLNAQDDVDALGGGGMVTPCTFMYHLQKMDILLGELILKCFILDAFVLCNVGIQVI